MERKNNKFCDECEFLNMTEEYQHKNGLNAYNHRCELFNEVLLHKGYRPKIPRLEKCIKYNFLNAAKSIKNFGDIAKHNIEDEYGRGYFNGIELCLSAIEERNPDFR